MAPRVTALSGEARNRIVAATSSTFGQAAKSAFGMALRFAGVSMIEGATAYKEGTAQAVSGIEAVDAKTVRFTLTDPNTSFLATTATWQLLPKHILSGVAPADAAKRGIRLGHGRQAAFIELAREA